MMIFTWRKETLLPVEVIRKRNFVSSSQYTHKMQTFKAFMVCLNHLGWPLGDGHAHLKSSNYTFYVCVSKNLQIYFF